MNPNWPRTINPLDPMAFFNGLTFFLLIFLLVFSFTPAICSAQTDAALTDTVKPNTKSTESSLQAMSKPEITSFSISNQDTYVPTTETPTLSAGYNAHWHSRIKQILIDHWMPTINTPKSILDDFDVMAAYFSRFVKVRELFTEIQYSAWHLRYKEQTHETQIRGRGLNIESITVLFDPRSAAQFKFYRACTQKTPFCVASPADVLLHELLHVKTVVTDTNTFIAQGGMDTLMYPFEHERFTIEEERSLYQSMTRMDRHPRPLRNEHSGRHVLAACVTCVR